MILANNGKCSAEMKIENDHANSFGTLHGGLTATLVDVISSYALLTHPKFVQKLNTCPYGGVSVDIHIS